MIPNIDPGLKVNAESGMNPTAFRPDPESRFDFADGLIFTGPRAGQHNGSSLPEREDRLPARRLSVRNDTVIPPSHQSYNLSQESLRISSGDGGTIDSCFVLLEPLPRYSCNEAADGWRRAHVAASPWFAIDGLVASACPPRGSPGGGLAAVLCRDLPHASTYAAGQRSLFLSSL